MDILYNLLAQTLWSKGRPGDELKPSRELTEIFRLTQRVLILIYREIRAVQLNNFWIRNRNPSLDLVCSTVKVHPDPPGKVHLSFEARHHPLVQLTAFVLVGPGLFFLVGIVIFVKTDSLPTAVASYFFSLWSIRAILSSEMKTFPTILDLAILSLRVLLLAALGFRLSLKEMRPIKSSNDLSQITPPKKGKPAEKCRPELLSWS